MARWVCVFTSILFVVAVMSSTQDAVAQSAARQSGLARITLDWGYALSYQHQISVVDVKSRDPNSARQMAALVDVSNRTLAQGLQLNAAYSLKPWFSLGIQGLMEEGFSAPTHPWLSRFDIRLGRRVCGGLGVFVEFRPKQRDYSPRHGLFLQTGLRWLWSHEEVLSQSPEVLSADRANAQKLLIWGGVGYRVNLRSAISMHLAADAGVNGAQAFAGLRLGGGFH